jgi:hypothetical protein
VTTELVRGQNLPLTTSQVEITLDAPCPVAVAAVLVGADLRVRSDADVLLDGSRVTGVGVAGRTVTVDLAAVPADVDRVLLGLTLEGGGFARFGAVAAPTASVRTAGAEYARFTISGLDTEKALQTVEVYRRQGAWKVRAVGQGYDTGFEGFLSDAGVRSRAALVDRARAVVAGPVAPAHTAATTTPPGSLPMAAPSAETLAEAARLEGRRVVEKKYEDIWSIFEDAARSAAAYHSTAAYAEQRLDKDLENILGDPSARVSAAGQAAQAQARGKYQEMVDQAQAKLDRDSGHLEGELAGLEASLPPALARWDSPAWAAWTAPVDTEIGVRLGDLHTSHRPGLRIPMVVRLPYERGLWIDSAARGVEDADVGDPAGVKAKAAEMAVALTARIMSAFPAGDMKLQIIDPEGKGTAAAPFAPLGAVGLFNGPAATNAAEVTALLTRLVDRVELARMAIESGLTDDLPAHIDFARQLLVVHDFPFAFDDRAAGQLRHLVEEGPRVGVHVMVVGSRRDAESFGPLLDPLWRSMLRLTPVPEDHIGDPWVQLNWTFTPDLPAGGAAATSTLLSWLAAAPRD